MKKRGRPSAALEIPVVDVVATVPRPDAPYDLTDEQSAEWWALVNRMPADWFPRETHGMLAQYCRHIVTARRFAQLIRQAEKADPFELEDYTKLLIAQERESRCIASLATRMRLSQQSLYDKTRQRPQMGPKPWDGYDIGPIK